MGDNDDAVHAVHIFLVQDVRLYEATGFNGILAKPFTYDDLSNVVSALRPAHDSPIATANF